MTDKLNRRSVNCRIITTAPDDNGETYFTMVESDEPPNSLTMHGDLVLAAVDLEAAHEEAMKNQQVPLSPAEVERIVNAALGRDDD